jgi:glucuronate isomerase
MERGELPADQALVGALVREVCFSNARDYFRLELAAPYAS